MNETSELTHVAGSSTRRTPGFDSFDASMT